MAGVSPEAMGKAPRRYRPSLVDERWLSPQQQRAIDHQRALILRREAGEALAARRLPMLNLAQRLEPHLGGGGPSPVPTTLASSRYMHVIKDRACGHLWEMVDGLSPSPQLFTAVPHGGDIAVDQLANFSPKGLVDQLRSSLYECGVAGQRGILFAVLEAEFQIRTQLFRFHWHGIASGGKLEVLDSARHHRFFHSPRRKAGEPKPDVSYRMNIRSGALYDLPNPLTYLIKPWFARWTNDAGKRGPRCRLPDDAMAQALLWLDRWSFSDVNLMMGVRCRRNGFTILNLHE